MGVQKFEDLIAWQKAQDLAVAIYTHFSSLKDFAFKDQIQRAAVSVSNNIAEGFDRASNAEFRRFLYYSIGSCSEVRSMLYLANRLNIFDDLTKESLVNKTHEVSKIIRGLIKSLQ